MPEKLNIENIQPYKDVTFGLLQLAQAATLVATAGQISLAALNSFSGGILGLFTGLGLFGGGGSNNSVFSRL